MKGRAYFNMIIIGMMLFYIYNLTVQYPDWYKNEIIKVMLIILSIIWGIFSIILHGMVIAGVFEGKYKQEMDVLLEGGCFSDIWSCIIFILIPDIMIYETIARFFDKHLSKKDDKR